jgi:hypothetical protein
MDADGRNRSTAENQTETGSMGGSVDVIQHKICIMILYHTTMDADGRNRSTAENQRETGNMGGSMGERLTNMP